MSRRNGKDYIYVVWKDPVVRLRHIIGELSKNGSFTFKYSSPGLEEAMEKGFQPLIAFSDIQKTYTSSSLFPAFNSRLPDKRRKDIADILSRYKLDKYDAFELLKKSGGRLPIDTLEFIDPIFLDAEEVISREFFISGVRHCDMCNNQKCSEQMELQVGEKLELVLEPSNKFDKNAVLVCNNDDKRVGYIPKYHSKAIFQCIEEGRKVSCVVIEVNKDSNCNECVKVLFEAFPLR